MQPFIGEVINGKAIGLTNIKKGEYESTCTSNNISYRKAFMRQETNADLKKEIKKRGVLIFILVIFMIVSGLIELFFNPPFFLGLILGAVLVASIKFTDSDKEYEAEW
jgi:polyferredoxin